MPPSFDFVVSAENNHYMAWQAMLFHYSCSKHMGQAPIIVVHAGEGELASGFERIALANGRVQRARNFRMDHGLEYAPRNSAGTLACVESDADYVILCDPDMIFLRPLALDRLQLDDDQVSFDWVSYLEEDQENLPVLVRACERAGVSVDVLLSAKVRGGVPHIVPGGVREKLSREWLRCIEYFGPETTPDGRSLSGMYWIASMWALVLAVHRLGLRSVSTRFSTANHPASRLFGAAHTESEILHYCYGDEEFDKRRFGAAADQERNVWRARARPESVHAEICSELRAAAAYYEIA